VRRLASAAASSETPATAAAGNRATHLLAPVAADLADGLVGRWTLGSAKWPFLPADLAKPPFQGGITLGRETTDDVLAGDYSVALWVGPPAGVGEDPAPFRCILRKSGWRMAILVAADGFVHAYHAAADGELARVKASQPLEGWTHLALVVDRARGRMQLLLNGQVSGEADCPKEGGISPEADPARPFRALAMETAEIGQVKYSGPTDDFRLYRRPLPVEAAKAIFHQGFAWR
jgi:hypothetical protein